MLLLLAIPAALLARWYGLDGVWQFLLSIVALLPLASLMGESTEELAARAGSIVGGLMNATFGNAAELLIAFFALQAGKINVVKASIAGSLLANLLFVLGISIFVGGVKHHRQSFNKQAAGLLATLLTLSLLAYILPTLFDMAQRTYYGVANPITSDNKYSLIVAAVLIAVYLANLLFSLVTHRDMLIGSAEKEETHWTTAYSLGVLLISTVGVALMAEIMVANLEEATRQLGLTEFFVGIVILPVVGNVAEQFAAVKFAIVNKMDLSVQIAVGSSLQIALLMAPLLVVTGSLIGRPFNLVFLNPLVLTALVAAIFIVNAVVKDGETHWLEGVMLLGVYALLTFAFFFAPH